MSAPIVTSPASLRTPNTASMSGRQPTRIGSTDLNHGTSLTSPIGSKRVSVQDFTGVKGAEGGAGAIGVRRRESNSFKHMSTGSLVSNSPFTKRLGAVNSTILPDHSTDIPATRTLYSGSRIPTVATAGRKTSGTDRKSSAEQRPRDSPVKENHVPRQLSGEHKDVGKTDGTLTRSHSTSPTMPFRPTRQHAASSSLDNTSSTSANTIPYGHTRSASATSAKPPASMSTYVDSPPLTQVPYEIAPLSQESAPNDLWSIRSDATGRTSPPPMSPKMANAGFGLGVRPGDAPAVATGGRRIAGAAIPPPNTPPHQRLPSVSSSPSPSSALSPRRLGIRGPRALTPGDETETEDLGKTLRRQPSGKTVTWAATEEVLEFEVDDRRVSGVSNVSSGSEDGRYYSQQGEGDSYEDDEDTEEGNSSMGFAEGGSIEVHDVVPDEDEDEEDDDGESAISSASTVDDIVGVIDDFILEESYEDIDVFSPSQIEPGFDLGLHAHAYQKVHLSPAVSAFSDSSTSQVPSSQDRDDVTSLSSYGDEESEVGKATREQILDRAKAVMSPTTAQQRFLPTPPTTSSASQSVSYAASAPLAQTTDHQVAYSLPEVPGISPFLGFEDDGAAGSVVTLDMERPVVTTQPLTPQRAPAQSTPTSARTITAHKDAHSPSLAGDSPIMSALGRMNPSAPLSPRSQTHQQPTPQQLSRQASIVHSETGSLINSDVGSWFGSMSSSGSPGKVFMSRDRLQQKMREHQDLLTGSRSSVNSTAALTFGSTPGSSSFSSSTGVGGGPGHFPVSSAATVFATGTAQSPADGREIQARPAPKARSATLSTSMLPTIVSHSNDGLRLQVGAPLTSALAHEMASPLDRLKRGAGEKNDGTEWRSGDSLIGISDAVRAGGHTLAHEMEEEDEDGTINGRKAKRGGKGGRRRSSSTSDANVAETVSAPMVDAPIKLLPRHGFEQHLDDALPGLSAGFASGLESSLDDIFNSRNRNYRMHERRAVVHAADVSTAVKGAGDVDPGRAWRKKRPSNMHEVNRSLSVMSMASTSASKKSKSLGGQLFVQLKEATIEGCPMPRERSSVTFSLDNGRQRVEAGVRVLDNKILIRNEFDLVCSDALTFTIDLHVPPRASGPPSNLSLPPPPSPVRSRGLRSLLSSPKKHKDPTPIKGASFTSPDPFYDYVSADGKLASAHFVFANQASVCRLKKHRFALPFENHSSPRSIRGSMVIDMLYVPSIPGTSREQLPKSMDEALQGMELAEYSAKISHEGVLTQLGGDCTVWRRRNFKLRGNRLVPYSEVTKQSHVEIDLALVTSVEDLNAPCTTGSCRSDEELGAMDNSFRLVFQDGSRIDFYADPDDSASKAAWMELLHKQIGTGQVRRPAAPVWALNMRRLVAAGKV